MTFQLFLVFTITTFIASIMPGPSMLLALTHGMQYGAKKTVASAFGNLFVTLIQAAVSIAGLGAILLASQGLFNIVKWLGAAYLVCMGIGLWRAPNMTVIDSPVIHQNLKVPHRKLFLQGVLVTAGNPKAIVFFTAIFPQFMDTGIAFVPQFALLMGTGSVIAFSCFMLYAVGGQKIVAVFSKAAVGKYINKIVGGTFIGAGIGLAISKK